MEGNLQLMLTKEQAALLVPILQHILPVNSLQVTDNFEAGQPQPGQTQLSVVLALPSTHDHLSYPAYDKQIQTAEEGSHEEAGTVEEQQKEIDTSNDVVCDESSSSEPGAGNCSQ